MGLWKLDDSIQAEDPIDKLVPQTFSGKADAALSTTSHNPPENSVVTPEINALKASLTDFSFRVNNGVPEYSIDGGTTWNKIGGGSMLLDFANQKELKGKTSVSVSNKDGMIVGIYAYSGISNAIQAVNIDGVFAFNLPISTHPQSFEIPVHVNSSITFSGSVAPNGDYFAFIPAK